MSAASSRTHKVLVYSNDAGLRDTVRMAIGRRPAADLGTIEFLEAGSLREVLDAVDAGGLDVVVLDGEARPSGGFGISKQLKDELHDAPATLVLCKRSGDAWLASWALADATQPLPVDAPALADAVVGLIRNLENGIPVLRAAAV
jgi:hypothetical protein